MPVAHIYPSQYESYNLTISNPSNMLTPVSSTTYATLTGPNLSSSNESELWLHDFNTEIIPANAVVNSFSIKLKYESNNLVVPSGYSHTAIFYAWDDDSRFYFNGNTVNLLALNTYNIPITGKDGNNNDTTLTYDELKNCLVYKSIDDWEPYAGSNIFITIPPSKYYSFENKLYGAEIEVDYSLPSNSKIFNMILPKG